jgi:hypothetical protein
MRKKVLVGAVVTAALAAPAAMETAPAGASSLPSPSCIGLPMTYPPGMIISARPGNRCIGYAYVCTPPFYPQQAAYFTNSDAIEDAWEAATFPSGFGHLFRCYGD